MKLYVGITDYDWFKLHSSKAIVDEVNFWKPSSQLGFKVLGWGEPFLFKLHAPRNFIVGGSTLRIKVSKRIREEFENGRDYYRLDDQQLRTPETQLAFPSIEKLKYHYENEFRG